MGPHDHGSLRSFREFRHLTTGVIQLRQNSSRVLRECLPEDCWSDATRATIVELDAEDIFDVL